LLTRASFLSYWSAATEEVTELVAAEGDGDMNDAASASDSE
jgi:hypothetical protein